ncbi:MAG: hypothetical protein MK086_14135 [Flavobacteriales bacterium]|nr:hypothetical protein [Flavobacteriales bacterium]
MGIVYLLGYSFTENFILATNVATLSYDISLENADTLDVYFDIGAGFEINSVVSVEVTGEQSNSHIEFPPFRSKDLERIRIDLGMHNDFVSISNVRLASQYSSFLLIDSLNLLGFNCIENPRLVNQGVEVEISCNDPYIEVYKKLEPLRLGEFSRRDLFILSVYTALFFGLLIYLWKRKPGSKLFRTNAPSNLVFATFFLLFIFVYWYSSLAGFKGVNFSLEKRAAQMFPPWGTDNYIAKFELWFEDHFVLRQHLMRLQSMLEFHLYQKSTLPHKVVLGEEKMMFATSAFMMDDYQGDMELTGPQLLSMQMNLFERIQFMNTRGGKYYLLWTPSKQTVYSDKLPSKYLNTHKPDDTMLSQFMNFIQEDSIVSQYVIDPRDYLIQKAKEQDKSLYYQYDMHWNSYGAYYGYEYTFNHISKNYPHLQPFALDLFEVVPETDNEADLARLLMLHNQCKRHKTEFELRDREPYDITSIYGKDNYVRYHTTSKTGTNLKVVVFRDSFCQDMIQFISPHFSEALYVWNQDFDPELIEERGANIVIQEITEMFIYDLLNVNPKDIRLE